MLTFLTRRKLGNCIPNQHFFGTTTWGSCLFSLDLDFGAEILKALIYPIHTSANKPQFFSLETPNLTFLFHIIRRLFIRRAANFDIATAVTMDSLPAQPEYELLQSNFLNACGKKSGMSEAELHTALNDSRVKEKKFVLM
jgi:hypothetical protein